MDLKSLFARRKSRLGALSGGGVLLLAGALAFGNLLSRRFFLRLDLTEGGRYSLSPASRRLVRSLPDPVLLRAYISGGLPEPYGTQARYVADLLGEYRSAGDGRVRLEVVDPNASEKARSDARKAGLTPARITQVASDKFQVKEGFIGLVVYYQDKQEVFPFVKDPSELEYDLTTRLRNMSRKGKKVLGLVTGQGEKTLAALQAGPAAKLFDAFEAVDVALSTRAQVTPDLLLIAGPSSEFKPGEVAVLDGYLSRGVPVAVFLSRRTMNMHNFAAYPRRIGLEPWLAHYGVRVGEEIVLDAQCQQVTFQSRQGGLALANIVDYPAFVVSRPNRDHPLTRSQRALGFPFANPLFPAASGGGLVVTPLARSTSYSWTPAEFVPLDPSDMKPPSTLDPKGPFTLAAAVEGSTSSFRDPAQPAAVRLLVVGTEFFLDGQVPAPPGNAEFLAGLAGWTAADKDFQSIPARGDVFRPLRRVPSAARLVVKAMGFFFLPAFTALWGLARWRRRERMRSRVGKEWREAAARA